MSEIVTINFRGDDLYGFKRDDGTFMAVKPMCEAMGIPYDAQRQRISRDPILSKAASIMLAPFAGSRGQEVTCLLVKRVNFWLAGVDTNRIKDEAVRERVLLYQEECADVLYDHFAGRAAPALPDFGASTDSSDSVRLRMVNEAGRYFGVRAAREMWFLQDLPIVPAMRVEQQADLFDPSTIRHPESEAA
ncbi:phage antirepressor N-terminal domain-containing protein [Sphingomonas sp. HMP6]|uniref:phage antirepressor N-terminal domain-containing protein n=1 Tax=Sphingomonas sp. HMP6 TaxID=1517551 RepID=UPI001596FEDD|nr:phage antirepressor N-terminal domain-containing protein [Sphingomonas sp. HMP6]BCA57680.1 hypothetical protein HMP06_0449 [Sphingomonas sp. HMP6]